MLRSRTFRSKKQQAIYDASLPGRYQKGLKKHPFLLFGLPFLTAMALASYWLSSFTSVRYERRDRKVQEVDDSEYLKIKAKRRNVDLKEEFYRLQGMAEEDWEPKRVPRMNGESENVW